MKNKNPDFAPHPLENREKVRKKGFQWFKEVMDGYVKAGKIRQPTEKELVKLFEETTGEKLAEKKTLKSKENG